MNILMVVVRIMNVIVEVRMEVRWDIFNGQQLL